MIRSAALRSRHLAVAGLHPDPIENQRASGLLSIPRKSFVRQVDEFGEPYWVPRTRRPRPALPPSAASMFQVSDLLLDLDAEDANAVRPFNEDDETRMVERWALSPERAAARRHLDDFKQQILSSRICTHKAFRFRLAVPQILPYDILSAALRGAPKPSVEPPSLESSNLESSSIESPSPRVEHERERLTKLCLENGIPEHALKDDDRLLRWMILRRQTLLASHARTGAKSPSRKHLSYLLERPTSLDDLRRTISYTLSANTYIGSFFKDRSAKGAMTNRIRTACDKLLSRSTDRPETAKQTLAFLGNLAVKFSAEPNKSIGTPLIGLAIRLSAEVGDLQALSHWMCVGFDRNVFRERKLATDMHVTLIWLRRYLSDLDGADKMQQDPERQLLFSLLTGTTKKGRSASFSSIRCVVMHYLERSCVVLPSRVLDLHASYLMLLAQLGAARLLWSEWQDLRRHRDEISDKYNPRFVDAMEQSFHRAACQVIHSAPPLDDERWGDHDWYQCSKRDYYAVARQRGGSFHAVTSEDLGRDEARRLLDLSLDEWTREVRRMRIERLPPHERNRFREANPQIWDTRQTWPMGRQEVVV
ncbi:hypothetical protein HIM_08444 [Hirsutella minnesotensis 3608]|uniref:Uncharacterized protein n=1 Tax=Hirsutella minnesotensis 3608 TaxID=1043627 RepID=A0A0F8A3P3_9HYPO|nr:hypothetical protein HIM_08444 [Hirsutella minnesotensis 3608]